VQISLNLHKLHQGWTCRGGAEDECWTPSGFVNPQLSWDCSCWGGRYRQTHRGYVNWANFSCQHRLGSTAPPAPVWQLQPGVAFISHILQYISIRVSYNAAVVINCSLISNAIQTLTITLIWMIVASLYM